MSFFLNAKRGLKFSMEGLLAGFTLLLASTPVQANPWLDVAPFELIVSESIVIQHDGSIQRDEHIVAGGVKSSENEYVIAVEMYRSLSKNSFYFVGLNSLTGETTWTKSIPKQVRLSGISSAENGSFVVVGTVKSDENKDDVYIGKFSEKGQLVWDQTTGGIRDEKGLDLVIDDEGNIYIFGLSETSSAGKKDALISKFNTTGELAWEKKFGGKKSEVFNTGIILNNGNILAGGYSKTDTSGGRDYYLIEVDVDGELIRERKFGSKSDEDIKSLHESKTGSVYIGAEGFKNSGVTGGYYSTFVKLGTDLGIEWEWKSKGEFKRQRGVHAISEFANGDVLFMSNTNYLSEKSSYAMRMDNTGKIIWTEEFKGRNFKSIVDLSADSLVTAGLRSVKGKSSPNLMWVKPYSSREVKAREEAKQARYRAEQENTKDSWGSLLGEVVKHGTGAVIASGAVTDADTVGVLTGVNAYAGIATGDSIQVIEAEQKGLIDSHLQKREEQQHFTANLDTQVSQIKQQQESLADENQRLKLELENARMKAELASLQGQQSNQPVAASSTINKGITVLYQLGGCKNSPSVWASSSKPKVQGKNVGVFKVYTVVKPYKTQFNLNLDDLALAEVDENQCYFEYEIENEDMPSEYYSDGPYYRIGSKGFFYASEQHLRDDWPSKIKEDGSGIYGDDKFSACTKANIDSDYNFPEKVRNRPNFMKKGWGNELKFVTNHSKHCGGI